MNIFNDNRDIQTSLMPADCEQLLSVEPKGPTFLILFDCLHQFQLFFSSSTLTAHQNAANLGPGRFGTLGQIIKIWTAVLTATHAQHTHDIQHTHVILNYRLLSIAYWLPSLGAVSLQSGSSFGSLCQQSPRPRCCLNPDSTIVLSNNVSSVLPLEYKSMRQ